MKQLARSIFSLIGCMHFESVGRTELDFELNLGEQRPTYEFRSDSGILYRVILLTSQVATFNCARAKVKLKGHIELKIEGNTSSGKLVKPFQIW